jgi:hypothetical protein
VALEARKRAIPVLMDIEKVREGMFDLLPVVDSLNTSSHFPAMYFRGAHITNLQLTCQPPP